jgi:serine/threonine-protein kinase HipA
MKQLFVYINDTHIGWLSQENGKISFQYTPKTPYSLALQLPIQTEPFTDQQTESFFSGLLPDEPIRSNIARILKVSPHNTFAMLKHLGGDCAGAIQILPIDSTENAESNQKTQPLSNDELFSILQNLPQRPLGIGIEGFRISGAGAQNKLVIAKENNQWSLPLYGCPSTHIIKPNIQNFPDSVLNEYFCMKLAQMVGIQVPEVEIITIQGHHFYAIKRYDREFNENSITRLHQEDFCQLLNIPPHQKYQKEGGPSIQQLFQTIQIFQKQGKMKGTETIRLLQLIIFNFLIGNGDAHGKNFSILYKANQVELAPGYDVLSTLVYGNDHTEKMAMKIDSKYKFKDVATRHFEQMGVDIGLSPKLVIRQAKTLSQRIRPAAKQLLQDMDHQGFTSNILKQIVAIIEQQTKLFI